MINGLPIVTTHIRRLKFYSCSGGLLTASIVLLNAAKVESCLRITQTITMRAMAGARPLIVSIGCMRLFQ